MRGKKIFSENCVSEKLFKDLKRVQDLVSTQTRKPATLEDTLEALVEHYLEKKDPMEKAKRVHAREQMKAQQAKTEVGPAPATNVESTTYPQLAPGQVESDLRGQQAQVAQSGERTRIPANLTHQVNLRDGQQCTHIDDNGKRCTSRRWLDIHHVHPIYLGGTNSLENLTTLCKAHHKMTHDEIES